MLSARKKIARILSSYFLTFLCAITTLMFCSKTIAQPPIEGFSHPFRSADVAAVTSGILDEWLIKEGDTVRKGQPLAKLDNTVHQTLVAIAEAAMNSRGEVALAEAELSMRKQRFRVIEGLANKGHATPDELQRAQSEADVATARLVTANEHLLQRRLEYAKLDAQAKSYTVRSPFDGVIKKLHKFPGEYVGPAEPAVCELVDLSIITASFLATSQLVEKLDPSIPVNVHFPNAGVDVEGTVLLSPYPDAETGMQSVKVMIDNRDHKLKAGWRCLLNLSR